MARDGGGDDFVGAVEDAVRALGPGEIATYGEIAEEAGFPGAARGVGRVMATSERLPWWRVVAANGRLVPGLEEEHARRLAEEGVAVTGGRVRRVR